MNGSLDLSGAARCLDALRERGVFVRFDGTVVSGIAPSAQLRVESIAWGQSRKLYSALCEPLQVQAFASLQAHLAQSERDLARLLSCSGDVSGRWLTEFPASWRHDVPDDKF